MEHAFGLAIPQTLAEICDCTRMARSLKPSPNDRRSVSPAVESSGGVRTFARPESRSSGMRARRAISAGL